MRWLTKAGCVTGRPHLQCTRAGAQKGRLIPARGADKRSEVWGCWLEGKCQTKGLVWAGMGARRGDGVCGQRRAVPLERAVAVGGIHLHPKCPLDSSAFRSAPSNLPPIDFAKALALASTLPPCPLPSALCSVPMLPRLTWPLLLPCPCCPAHHAPPCVGPSCSVEWGTKRRSRRRCGSRSRQRLRRTRRR